MLSFDSFSAGKAPVRDMTFFRHEHLPPMQWHLWQLQSMRCKNSFQTCRSYIQYTERWLPIPPQAPNNNIARRTGRWNRQIHVSWFVPATCYLKARLACGTLPIWEFLPQTSFLLIRSHRWDRMCFQKVAQLNASDSIHSRIQCWGLDNWMNYARNGLI